MKFKNNSLFYLSLLIFNKTGGGDIKVKALRIGVVVILTMVFWSNVWAQEKSNDLKKIDTKNLENKYWQPSDESYSVVQSRTYSKKNRVAISLSAGPLLIDNWSTGLNYDFSLAYYFSERWGLEFQGAYYDLDKNDAIIAVNELKANPDHGVAESFMGLYLRWVPFYSKMSFMGIRVIYFDMSLGLGGGVVNYNQILTRQLDGSADGSRAEQPVENVMSFGFDISQTYFVTPYLAFRVDYKMRFFDEEVVAYNTNKNKGVERGDILRNAWTDLTTLNLGLTYYF